MIIVAAALAWLGAGCSSTATTPNDSSASRQDTASDTSTTADGASADSGPTICTLDATYTYGPNGGLVASTTQTTLAPPASYLHTTTFLRLADPPAPLSCTPALPACGDGARIDVSDIARDLADPDVVQAMAMSTPPLYGQDSRPTDGTMFQILRSDGHGFLAGPTCYFVEFCYGSVPAGIVRLVADLQALDQQQLADPSCAAQNPPQP